MKSFYLISFVFLFSHCKETNNKSIVPQNNNFPKQDSTIIAAECIQRDTITPSGSKIHYINKDGKFQISWSDGNDTRVYDSLFSCDYDTLSGLWDFVPKLYCETKDNLIFEYVFCTSSGGNPDPLGYTAIVFPKNLTDSIYEKDCFINLINDYLIYGDEEINDTIYILNLKTKKAQTITLNPKPGYTRFPTLAIRETMIKKNILSVKYEIPNRKLDAVIIKKDFQLNI